MISPLIFLYFYKSFLQLYLLQIITVLQPTKTCFHKACPRMGTQSAAFQRTCTFVKSMSWTLVAFLLWRGYAPNEWIWAGCPHALLQRHTACFALYANVLFCVVPRPAKQERQGCRGLILFYLSLFQICFISFFSFP